MHARTHKEKRRREGERERERKELPTARNYQAGRLILHLAGKQLQPHEKDARMGIEEEGRDLYKMHGKTTHHHRPYWRGHQ